MPIAARLAAALVVAAAVPAAMPARADVTAEAAASLQTQLRGWMEGLAGPGIDLTGHSVTVTPAGQAFRVELPVTGAYGDMGWSVTAEPVSALVKPLEGGLWSIDSLHLPSPLRTDRTGGPGPRGWVMKLAEQDIHGVFDPSLSTATSLDATLRGYAAVTQMEHGTQTTHFDRYAWHGGWQPLSEGRVAFSGEGRGENLTIGSDVPGGAGRVLVTAAAIRNSGRVERLSFDRLGSVVRSLTGLLPSAVLAASAGGAPDSITPEDRDRLRALVGALRDLLGGVRAETVMEKVKLEVAGQTGTIERVSLAGGGAAPGGKLDASLRMAWEGIDSPLVPKGPLRDYLPRRITLAPHLSGLPADELMALLLRAIDADDPSALADEASDLLAKGPLKLGLDELVLDLGAAVLKATGAVTVAGTDDIDGSVRVEATGVDALIRRANAVPELRSVAPVLIFLKGIGEQKGEATVWNLTYADGHAQVNGTDLGALTAPGGDADQASRRRKN